jgi:hypothetical protein
MISIRNRDLMKRTRPVYVDLAQIVQILDVMLNNACRNTTPKRRCISYFPTVFSGGEINEA